MAESKVTPDGDGAVREPSAPEAEGPEAAPGAAPATPDAAPPPAAASGDNGAGGDAAADEKSYYATIYPGPGVEIPTPLAERVRALEQTLGVPTWVVLQTGVFRAPYALLDDDVRDGFFRARRDLGDCQPLALVIDSYGGFARDTYQVAKLLRRHCGGFLAVVPRMAKSAATLLTLGADDLLVGRDAELGPLDVQVYDPESEEELSALDEVQALERLNAVALDQLDQTMSMLSIRTGKKTATLLPHALDFTAKMMAPLLHKIDTIHYAKQSRLLKVAEDYAGRLLERKYGTNRAQDIARHFVNDYTEHGFVIDREEVAAVLDLRTETEEQGAAIADLEEYLTSNPATIIGRIVEEGGDDDGHEERPS